MNIPKTVDRRKLHELPNVQSVGWGTKIVDGKPTNEKAVVVGVTEKVPMAALKEKQLIPRAVDGLQTDVQIMPKIYILPAFLRPLSYTAKERPFIGGISGGHPDITAGTISCFCLDANDNICLLTNNHVAANSNAAQIGDPFLQPGAYDGGIAADVVAELAHFTQITMAGGIPDIPDNCMKAKVLKKIIDFGLLAVGSRFRISFEPVSPYAVANKVDAALCRLTSEKYLAEIKDIGKIAGVSEAYLGQEIQKTGRTTEHSHGQVTQLEVSLSVQYGAGQVAFFDDQIISDIPSDGGDSGSAILDLDNRICGLLFAGGEGITVFNKIQNVIEAEGIKSFL